MIVGADASTDRVILGASSDMYARFALKRVYYSAFSPIPDASTALPPRAAPLLREHRLYQADWLLRFYGFAEEEITTGPEGNLSLEMDPKLAWALAHRERFPVDVNTAPREMLLRVPGMGVKSVASLLVARRHRRLRLDDLARLRLSLPKITPFVVTVDHMPKLLDSSRLVRALPRQMSLFA
jgi:predicted DNA-binding helix-hairpin-helix protein